MPAMTFEDVLKSAKYNDFVIDAEIDLVVQTWTDTDGIYSDGIEKAGGNPYHDEKGRFTTGPSASSMIRQGPPPKKTKIAYKVFVAKDGKLYPPMVANPDGQATPVGVWLDASAGKLATDKDGNPITNTLGRNKVKAGGKGTQGGSGTLAYRPGWHLGEVPEAKQFYTKDKATGEKKQKKNFVWAECEIAADVDYQKEAMSYGYNKNGKFQHSLAGLPKIPTDGYYTYRTNPDPTTKPWYITGAMKVNRILTDAETNKILRSHGIEPMKRDGGELDLAALGFTQTDFTNAKKSDGINKANPYHDELGRFTSATTSGAKNAVTGMDLGRLGFKFNSNSDKTAIEQVIDAQGYDGKPTVTTNSAKFDALCKASNFIAKRSVGATDQQTMNAYDEELKNGEFYVKCTGGNKYGYGLYCCAVKASGDMASEGINHAERSVERFNQRGEVQKTYTFTMDKSAKIGDFNSIEGEMLGDKRFKELCMSGGRIDPEKHNVGVYATYKGYDAYYALYAPDNGSSSSFAVVLNRSKMIIYEGEQGATKKGYEKLTLKRDENGKLWSYNLAGEKVGCLVEYEDNTTTKEAGMEQGKQNFLIQKADEDKHLVFGWASIAITVDGEQLEDRQKDIIDPEDLEEAAYDYVLNFRDTGEEHIATMRKKGKLVESCVFTAEKQKAIGIPEGILPTGWWVGFKITDDDAWERIKNGTYRMFSIEGKANREPVGKSAETVAKTFDDIIKGNPNHGPDGRFTTSGGIVASGKKEAVRAAIRDLPGCNFKGEPQENQDGSPTKFCRNPIESTDDASSIDTKLKELKQTGVDPWDDQHSQVKEIPVDSLKTQQNYLKRADLESIMDTGKPRMAAPDNKNEDVKVVTINNSNVLIDGNHRSALAKLAGNKTIKARVFNMDET